jgi:tetratricopeptide (TPR) repeat protein
VLGDELFGRIYRRCLKEFTGRRLGVAEFRAFCEQESGRDLGWFFDQWVNSNKYLSYEIASQKCEKKGDTHVTEIEVRRLGTLKMPVPVAVEFEDGTTQLALTNRLRDVDKIRLKSRSPLKGAELDPDEALAMVVPPPLPGAKQIGEIIGGLPWVGAGDRAREVFEQARERELSDAGSWYKLGMMLYDGENYKEALVAFRTAQEQTQGNSARAFAVMVWQGHLLDLLGQRAEALKRYQAALEIPGKLEMRHDQYGMRLNRQWVQERLKEPFRRE